jgi:very-short-patch-repair endonuclease
MDLSRLDAWGVVVKELAVRQAGTVSRHQLLDSGLTATQVRHAQRAGRLHRMHRGVYGLLPPAALPRLARHHAALLACGPHALLSHHTAAQLLGLERFVDTEIHVTSTDDRRHPGLIVHRTRALPRSDRTKVGRLRVTSIPRTVDDLARTLDSDRAFERLVDEALKHVSQSKLTGVVRVRTLLRTEAQDGGPGGHWSSLTRSAAEERLLAMIRHAGLPEPEVNVALGDYVPDFLWRQQRVIVEFDSYRHHSGPAAFHAGHARHNDLTAVERFEVLHVTWRHRPEQVLVWIATALARHP